MKPGSVIVDLAVEQGGNCPLTERDKVVVKHGVTLVGHSNLPAMLAADASALYARNVLNFVNLLVDPKTGALKLNRDDEIIAGALVCIDGTAVKRASEWRTPHDRNRRPDRHQPHRLRPRGVRRLPRGLERDAGAAHAADERHQRHQLGDRRRRDPRGRARARRFGSILGTVAVGLAAVNTFGGFLVSQRMLEMFKKEKKGVR